MKEILICAFIISMLITGTLVILVSIICLVKNEFTYRNHMKISNAVYAYNVHLIEEGLFDPNNRQVTFDDMEDYGTTLKRFWDWGYKRILPPEKFELIKPFIKD